MAGIRERKYKADGITKTYFEISWYSKGKQYKKGGFKSKIDAQIALGNIVTDATENIKFGVLAQAYIDRHCALNCKTTTKELYQAYLDNHLADISNCFVKDLKKRDIEYIILQLKNKGRTHKTINCVIGFIQAVLNYALDSDYLIKNPIRTLHKLPIVKPSVNSLNETQIKVFIEKAKECKHYALLMTALNTGMRISEIIGLEWSDIDFKRNRIIVNKQIYRGVRTSTKTNKERVIDIPQTLTDILQEHKKKNTYLSKLVFHNGEGKPVHIASMKEHYFYPLIKKCNDVLDEDNQIVDFRFHDLRHSYATLLLSNGVPIKYVQEQLGHSSAKMTMDVYASVMPSVKFGALNILENMSTNGKKEHKKNIEN